MRSNNAFLDNIFNNTSSIFNKDNGMIHSNLFIMLNAYAEQLNDIDRLKNDTLDDTYLKSAHPDALENNFGSLVNFPKPPRLNTVTDGDEVYREILNSIFSAYLNGATELGMDVGLTTILSFLTQDETSTPVLTETNTVFLNTYNHTVELTYNATNISGNIAASVNDFIISPSGLTVSFYDDIHRTLTLSGNIPSSGQSYDIEYFRSHVQTSGTNWINFTNESETLPLPYNLNVKEKTFRNPHFSYWWNTFNRDGNGVLILDGTLDKSEQALVWRLPEKSIEYVSPYDGLFKNATINLYNLSGTIYDINDSNKDINPDFNIASPILNYSQEVSKSPNDFYVRYSANNSNFVPLTQFAGGFNFNLNIKSNFVVFNSNDFGTLDFFEKGTNFNQSDLFGFGTKHIWTNVKNTNGEYVLNDTSVFNREINFHKSILLNENFESGIDSLNKFTLLGQGQKNISEIVGVPLQQGEDCLQIVSSGNGLVACLPKFSPISILTSGNSLNVDFLDSFASGTNTFSSLTYIDSINSNIFTIDVGIDKNINSYNDKQPYYYKIHTVTFTPSPVIFDSGKVYLNNVPREYGWHKLELFFDKNSSGFSGLIDNYTFLNTNTNVSSGNLAAISLNQITNFPNNEFSYFDNFSISNYTPTQVKPEYQYSENIANDWQGAFLDQGTILNNKKFKGDKSANFIFELAIKGLQRKFLFIIKKIVNTLKPAHTLVEYNIQTDHVLNTTTTIVEFNNQSDNWETGNLFKNIIINQDVESDNIDDLPGAITIP